MFENYSLAYCELRTVSTIMLILHTTTMNITYYYLEKIDCVFYFTISLFMKKLIYDKTITDEGSAL